MNGITPAADMGDDAPVSIKLSQSGIGTGRFLPRHLLNIRAVVGCRLSFSCSTIPLTMRPEEHRHPQRPAATPSAAHLLVDQ